MVKIKKYIKKYLYIIICIIIIIIIFFITILFENKNTKKIEKNNFFDNIIQENNIEKSAENKGNNTKEKNEKIEKSEEKNDIILIHIMGEINNPGVYSLNKGDRIITAVEKAGGVTQNADLMEVNLAYELSDGDKIIIPKKIENNEEKIQKNTILKNEESVENTVQKNNEKIIKNNKKSEFLINLNNASQTELELLDGIGPSIASQIIEYRNENGGFKKIDEIKNVKGISDLKYKKIQDKITV